MYPGDPRRKNEQKGGLRDWLTTVKAAIIVFAGIGAIIILINSKSLSKLSRCAANIFFVANITLQKINHILRVAVVCP